MRLKFFTLLLIILQISCKNKTESKTALSTEKIQKTKTQKIEVSTETPKSFDFDKFKISNGHIGEIKIGMNIDEAEKFLTQLTKK